MTTFPPEPKVVSSVRVVTTRGIIYDFLLSEKSRFKRGWRTISIKNPVTMRITTPTGSNVIEASVMKVTIRTTYVKEVREE